MSDDRAVANALEKALPIKDKLKRALYVIGFVSRELPPDSKPVIVGGTAVEFYTLGTVRDSGCRLGLIGIEDLILDRLQACVHWRSEADCEWARRLMAAHRNDIDWVYLFQAAEKEGLKDRLDALNGD